MKALFVSKNLIGDALYIQPALKAWQEGHPDWDIDLMTLDDHITCLYRGMGLKNLNVIFERPTDGYSRDIGLDGLPLRPATAPPYYDFEHVFNVSDAFSLAEKEPMHLSQAYARLLGVEIPEFPRVEYTPEEGPSENGLVLLSVFSKSCASREGKRPNKMLSWAHWLPILILARQAGSVRVLGGPADESPLPLTREEILNGAPLPDVARLMRDAKMLITIDNGMGHLAATQGTPTILFYPTCLSKAWIVPSGNPNMVVCHMDPCVIGINDAMNVVRTGMKRFWGIR